MDAQTPPNTDTEVCLFLRVCVEIENIWSQGEVGNVLTEAEFIPDTGRIVLTSLNRFTEFHHL